MTSSSYATRHLKMDGILVEVQERILWFLRNDPVTLHRAEQVCLLWTNIVGFFEKYISVRWRTIKVYNFFEKFSE